MTSPRAYTARLIVSAVVACALPAAVVLSSCGAPPDEELVAAPAVEDEPDDTGPVVVVVAPTSDLDGPREAPEPEEPIPDDAECLKDEDCSNGVFCDGFEVCAPNYRCVPARPIECPAMLPFCDEDQDTCVCTPGSCPAPSTCDGFSCM